MANPNWVKGHKKVGGKKKGTPNKTTQQIRDAFQMLVENNLENMTKWLKAVAKEDPARALVLIKDLSEFIIPKLARTELTGYENKKIEFNISSLIKFEEKDIDKSE